MEWAVDTYRLEGVKILRPFYPGGNYENEDYSGNIAVIDNPPFSIISKICNYYLSRNIRFFLFAPALTLFSVCRGKCNYIAASVKVKYENGAIVCTSFVTNMGCYKICTAPDLHQAVRQAQPTQKNEKPLYKYPDNVVAFSTFNSLSAKGADIKIENGYFVSALDAQKQKKKGIYGGGFLISDSAAERVAAEWCLSDRERQIVRLL